MKTIWKYQIPSTPSGQFKIDMPHDSNILSVQTQNDEPNMWIECSDSPVGPKHTRYFAVYPTGGELPYNPGKYCGTFQMLNGMLVYHVYEESTQSLIDRAKEGL